MNLLEAFEMSKKTGLAFGRRASSGSLRGHGWVRYDEGFTYRFSVEEIMATDWALLAPHKAKEEG